MTAPNQNQFTQNSWRTIKASNFEEHVTLAVQTYEGKPYFVLVPKMATPGYHLGRGERARAEFGIRLPASACSFNGVEGMGSCGTDVQKTFEANPNQLVPLEKLDKSLEQHFLFYTPDAAELLNENTHRDGRPLMEHNQEAHRMTVNNMLVIEFLIRRMQVRKQHQLNLEAAADPTKPATVVLDIEQYMSTAEQILSAAGKTPTDAELTHKAAEQYYRAQENLLFRTLNKYNRSSANNSDFKRHYPLPERKQVMDFTMRLVGLMDAGDASYETVDHDPEHPMMWTEDCGKPRAKWVFKFRGSRPALLKPKQKNEVSISSIHAWQPKGIAQDDYIRAEAEALGYTEWKFPVAQRSEDDGKMHYLNRDGDQPLIPRGSFTAPYITLQLNTKGGIRRSITGAIVLSIEGSGGQKQEAFDVEGEDVVEFSLAAKRKEPEPPAETNGEAGGAAYNVMGEVEDDTVITAPPPAKKARQQEIAA